MKTYPLRLLSRLFLVVSLIVGLFACSDDDEDQKYPSALTNTYSNKVTAGNSSGTLEITYSGGTIYGKEVYFEMTGATTAKLKLYHTLPGESESVIENIALTASGDGYTFNSSTTASNNTTFTYNGTVQKGALKLNLTDINIPNNILTNKGSFTLSQPQAPNFGAEEWHFDFPVALEWYVKTADNENKPLLYLSGMDLNPSVQTLLSNLIYLLLSDVTFQTDGNIRATYSKLPEDTDILSMMSAGVDPGMRTPAMNSPINLCYYYVNDNLVYIRPDLEMIIRLVMSNRTKTKAEELDINEILNKILDLYPYLNRWTTEGIKFHLEENKAKNGIPYQPEPGITTITQYYAGDYILYIDEEEFAPVISLIPMIIDLIEIDFSSNPMLAILEPILDEIIASTQQTTSLKLGLYLSLDQ